MRGIRLWSLVCGSLICVVSMHAQEKYSVAVNAECITGKQILLAAPTYHSDPLCAHWATAPDGGCTQWKLFRDGQHLTSKYTVPVRGSILVPPIGSMQVPDPPLDYYNWGWFTLSKPGTYQIRISYARQTCRGEWIFRKCTTSFYENETPTVVVSPSDFDPATWQNKCPLGSFDGANCFVMAKPPGGFMFERGFYVPPSKTTCPVGNYDGANCYLMAKPATGFIWMNGFYVKSGQGGSCSVGTFDGANCFIMKAPLGTKAFEWEGKFYVSPLPSCPQGTFDGANCLLASAPLGTNPFELNGKFYFTPRKRCR